MRSYIVYAIYIQVNALTLIYFSLSRYERLACAVRTRSHLMTCVCLLPLLLLMPM